MPLVSNGLVVTEARKLLVPPSPGMLTPGTLRPALAFTLRSSASVPRLEVLGSRAESGSDAETEPRYPRPKGSELPTVVDACTDEPLGSVTFGPAFTETEGPTPSPPSRTRALPLVVVTSVAPPPMIS